MPTAKDFYGEKKIAGWELSEKIRSRPLRHYPYGHPASTLKDVKRTEIILRLSDSLTKKLREQALEKALPVEKLIEVILYSHVKKLIEKHKSFETQETGSKLTEWIEHDD